MSKLGVDLIRCSSGHTGKYLCITSFICITNLSAEMCPQHHMPFHSIQWLQKPQQLSKTNEEVKVNKSILPGLSVWKRMHLLPSAEIVKAIQQNINI